jgi:ABC-type glycerol-3-phosphate transport system substrate-binding protein
MKKILILSALLLFVLSIAWVGAEGGQEATQARLKILVGAGLKPVTEDSPLQPIWEASEKRFHVANPNVELVYDVVPWNELWIKFAIVYDAGNSPDVIYLPDMVIIPTAKAGRLMPLDDLIPEELLQDYTTMLEEKTYYRGKKYAVTTNTDVRISIYNKKLFREAGLDPEGPFRYWEDVMSTGQKLTDKSRDRWAYGAILDKSLHAPLIWGVLPLQAGGDVIDENGQAIYNQPPGVRSARYYYDLLHEQEVMSRACLGLDENGVQRAFLAGQFATIIVGNWHYPTILSQGFPEEDLGWAPIPYPKNGKPASISGCWEWVISSKCKTPGIAWDYVAAFTDKEHLTAEALTGFRIPTRKSLIGHPAYASSQAHREMVEFQNKYSVQEPSTLYPLEYCEGLATALQKILSKEAPVQAALDAAAQDYNTKYLE